MSLPLPPTQPDCPHGRRAGISTCLYCRQDARVAARQRRNRLIARVSLVGLGGGVLVALTVGALVAVAPRSRPAPVVAVISADSAPTVTLAVADSSGLPIVREGRTELGSGVFAQRTGREVMVSFDTESLRTRFDRKFEGVVRSTLPMVFGDDARIALDSILHGRLARGRSLLYELPSRGIPLTLRTGDILTVWPVTRAGLDGPLVVAYKALIKD